MLKKLLSQSSYWIINKDLVSKLGFEPTLLLTHLIECADMLDQPFYQQKERIKNETFISERVWRHSIKLLTDYGILIIEKKGNPAKNYYTIVESELLKLLNYAPTSEAQMSLSSEAQMSLSSAAQMGATKTRSKTSNKTSNNISEGVEGGTIPKGLSPTSSTPHKEKKGGWEKLVDLFPENKQRGIIEGAIIWNELSQSEKQEVMRHIVPYLKNTEMKFIKQIGNYMQSRLWEQMKSPTKAQIGGYKKTGMIDYNFINWYNLVFKINNWEEANKDFQLQPEETKKEMLNEYERIRKTA